MSSSYVWESHSADQTKQLGTQLAPLLHSGDVIILTGDLGAGKTQFVQGVALGLHIHDDVTSPTFDLITTYTGGRLPLNHADLYRLETPDQLDDIGYWDALESGAVNFIEWGNRFRQAIPDECLELAYSIAPDGTRKIKAYPYGTRYVHLLDAWKAVHVRDRKSDDLAVQHKPQSMPQADLDFEGEVHPGEKSQVKGCAQDKINMPGNSNIIVAMDTSNESVAIGFGAMNKDAHSITPLATTHFHTHRASNEQLLPELNALMQKAGIKRNQIRAVAAGVGPGSFTGVRICLATAKGIAEALHVALVGISTMDAVAYRLYEQGKRGHVLVLADAMRKEVYPVSYTIDDDGIHRQNDDTVIKATRESEMLHAKASAATDAKATAATHAKASTDAAVPSIITGDGLVKYAELFHDVASLADREVWVPSGASLLACAEESWQRGDIDPYDVRRHDPAYLLPVYTRLSDAEENEKAKAHNTQARDLHSGVQHTGQPVAAPDVQATSKQQVAGMDLWVDQETPQHDIHAHHPLLLAIESSCDETGAAIIDGNGEILADVVASQIDFHARFGGVVPEIASRKHIEAICGVTQTCLDLAAKKIHVDHLSWSDLDGVGVTYAPGLIGGLVVGVAFAKGASWACDIPCIAVNHLEGHMFANKITDPHVKPPFVASLISGGNTMLVHVHDWGNYHVMGQTLDDAVGEAFDKVSKALGRGYPGGPVISKLAKKGNPRAIHFPRAMMHSGDLRFSLSGLKTAVITYIEKEQRAGHALNLPDIAASFEAAVIDVQVAKARHAIQMTGVREFCVGGGVAANPELRKAYKDMCRHMRIHLVMPPASACTDNASMIALVALERFKQHKFMPLSGDAYARADLNKPY